MKCENIYCVYQKKYKCLNEKIEIDKNGVCKQYMQVDMPEHLLEAEKERILSYLLSEPSLLFDDPPIVK